MTVLGRFRRDNRAATAVEFAIVAPVMCLVIIGASDMAHNLYTRGVLQGVVQKTARDATLESSTDAQAQATLDNKVRAQVYALASNATVDIKRRYYRTFSQAAAAQAEPWTDTDHNGTCNAHEPYQDNNNNAVWDADGGNSGQGGAKDRTLYTVTVTYPRLFPIDGLIGGSDTVKLVATTVLENQPYDDQGTYGAATVKNCP